MPDTPNNEPDNAPETDDACRTDPDCLARVYTVSTAFVTETLNTLLSASPAGVTVKVLLEIPNGVLSYYLEFKSNPESLEHPYEVIISSTNKYFGGLIAQQVLAEAVLFIAGGVLGASVGVVSAIAVGAGSAIYMAYNYESQIKPAFFSLLNMLEHMNDAPLINHARLMEIMSQEPHIQNNMTLSLGSRTGIDSYLDMSYIPGSVDGTRPFSEFLTAFQEVREEMTEIPASPLFTTPKIVASLPDGQYTAYVGTVNGEVLDASNEYQPVELYGQSGNDTLLGSYGDDHHDGGYGNDLLRDPHGKNTYYFSYNNNGYDVVDDAERSGTIMFATIPVEGVVEKIAEAEGRYRLVRDDVTLYFTRVNEAGVVDPSGSGIVMTFDEVYEGASNSVLIKNFASGDFGIFLEGSTQFRVPDMYVESMSRFANGNIFDLRITQYQ